MNETNTKPNQQNPTLIDTQEEPIVDSVKEALVEAISSKRKRD